MTFGEGRCVRERHGRNGRKEAGKEMQKVAGIGKENHRKERRKKGKEK